MFKVTICVLIETVNWIEESHMQPMLSWKRHNLRLPWNLKQLWQIWTIWLLVHFLNSKIVWFCHSAVDLLWWKISNKTLAECADCSFVHSFLGSPWMTLSLFTFVFLTKSCHFCIVAATPGPSCIKISAHVV